MTMPQVLTPAAVAHYAEVRDVLVTSCQAYILVVVLRPPLSTGVVVLVVGHHRARSGCWSSTSRLVQRDRVSNKHVSKR
jgi:hypothetical protein